MWPIGAVFMTACSPNPKPLDPAAYVPPAVGTTYRYVGFQNVVVASDGWRVRIADEHGREGLRVGTFITDDPTAPATVDTADLARLWPLRNGNEVILLARRRHETSRWMFKVVGQALVDVPAGTFQTYVVQGVQRPDEFNDPKTQTTLAFTWWFAPSINAVVRFATTYVSGPSTGHVVASSLQSVEVAKASTEKGSTVAR